MKICTFSTFCGHFGADGSVWHVNLTAEELCTVHLKEEKRAQGLEFDIGALAKIRSK